LFSGVSPDRLAPELKSKRVLVLFFKKELLMHCNMYFPYTTIKTSAFPCRGKTPMSGASDRKRGRETWQQKPIRPA
jgi:hypothetical protein